MHLLVIDNYDSFTYNIVQYFGELGAKLTILRNDDQNAENGDWDLENGDQKLEMDPSSGRKGPSRLTLLPK